MPLGDAPALAGALATLLRDSLALWSVRGTVSDVAGGGVLVRGEDTLVRIEPVTGHAGGARWIVVVGDGSPARDRARRPVRSVLGVVEEVRAALAPAAFAPGRVRFGVVPARR